MPQPFRQCPRVVRSPCGRMWKRAGYGGAGGGGRSEGAEIGCFDQPIPGSRRGSGGWLVIGGSAGEAEVSGVRNGSSPNPSTGGFATTGGATVSGWPSGIVCG